MEYMDQDQVLLSVREQDIRKRMDNGQKLVEYLSTLEGNLKWDNVDRIIDSLATYWVSSSNFKVALLGLDIISLLVERLEDEFQFHYNSVQNALIDRLGDQKEQVRSASITLLTNIMDASASPQFIFDRLTTVFSHKIWRVREGLCSLLIATINRFGARSLTLSKIVPHVCKLLSDPNAQVRDTALTTLSEIYRHVGEKVRQDIMKRGLPQNRLAQVLERFDEIYHSGKMEMDENETASVTSSGSFGSAGSTTVNSSSSYMKPPASTYVPNSNNRVSSATAGRASSVESKNRVSQSATGRRSVLPPRASTVEAGAVDEDTFLRSMDKGLPTIKMYNARDFDEIMNKTFSILSDEKKDWEERSKALKTVRAILVAGGAEQESFSQHFRIIEPALRLNAKDLRSQVVRETCLTIGQMSMVLKNRFDRTAEALFPTLFNLVPNSAKIMATSGVTTIRIILRNTHAPRLIPIITGNCTSKSTAVRRRTFGFLDLVLQEWSTPVLEKQLALLIEAVKKGIADADSEARSEARKSWWGLHSHFPSEAERLYNSLTSSQQKMIQGQLTASSSTDSIPRSTSSDSHPSVNKRPPSSRQSLLPNAQRVPSGRVSHIGSGPNRTIQPKFSRSRSDIDPSAAKRSAQKAMNYPSVGRARQPAYSTSNGKTPEKRGRNNARPANSQPNVDNSSTVQPSSSLLLPSPVAKQSVLSDSNDKKSLLSSVLVKNAEKNRPKDVSQTETNDDSCKPKRTFLSRLSKTLPSPGKLKKLSARKTNQSDSQKNASTNEKKSSPHFSPPQNRSHLATPKIPVHKQMNLEDNPSLARPLSPKGRVSELFLNRNDQPAGSRSNSPNSKLRYYGSSRTPTSSAYRTSRAHTVSSEDSPEHDLRRGGNSMSTPGYTNGAQRGARIPVRTPPSSPTPTRRSRIPVSTSRSGSRAGSRVGSRVGSPSGSRGSSPPRYKGRGSSSSNAGYISTGPAMRVLPKGREGEQVLSDALLGRKTPKRRGESYGYSDNDDDFSDTSSVCSDRSSSYQSSRNGVRRSHNHVHTEDIAEILTLCQSSNWAERKEGLLSLHGLIKKEKLISRMEMKKILEIFTRLFADPHGKVFSLFLEILPDFVATYKENIEEWLYVLMTQLLKKMGADLLGSVQAKVIKAMQTTRVSFSPKQQFNILTRYIVDQTQTPNLKVKVALLHYLLDLITLMDSADINSNSEMRLVISRIITWTTEPKSQDVRKAAESVVISLFELNPGEFSMMLRILPKTFQDGAMKVLHFHMKSNGDGKLPTHPAPATGRVTARIGMSPSGQVVSPHGSISGTADIMSPRGSEVDYGIPDGVGMDGPEENLNFRDITAEIHKLRLDSSTDALEYQNKDEKPLHDMFGAGDANTLPQVCYPPPFQQLQNTPKQLSANRGINNKYNPGIYSEKTLSPPFYNREALKEAMFDDDDTISDEFSQEEASIITQLTQALQKKSQRKVALMDFRKVLRSGDQKLFLSGKSYQWESYFVPLLTHVLECMRDEEAETRVLALSIMKEMLLRIPLKNFEDYIETIICTVLEAHKDRNAEVVRSAEDTTVTLGVSLPADLCFQVLIPFLSSEHLPTMQASIKMITNAINKAQKEELTPKIVNDIVPCLIKGYDSAESSMRKAAVFCLVAIHQVIGEEELQKHLSSLSGSKMKLLQLYIKRAQASGH